MNGLNSYFYNLGKLGKTDWSIWIAGFCVPIAALTLFRDTGRSLFLLWYEKYPQYTGWLPNFKVLERNSVDEAWYQLYLYAPYIVLLSVSLFFVQKYLRKRPIKDIITGAPRFQWNIFLKTVCVYLFVLTCAWLVKGLFAEPGDLTYVFKKEILIVWPVIILCAPAYAAVQEVFFRGFITQGLAIYIKTPLIAFVVSGAIYAASYFYAINVLFGWQAYFAELFVYGMLMCIITSMCGGLEAAIGVSATNGLVYTLFISSYMEYDTTSSVYSLGTPQHDGTSFFTELAILSITAIVLSYILPQTSQKEGF